MDLIHIALVVALAGDGADAAADRASLEKQCRDLGERIETSINAGDPFVLDALVDRDAIAEAATRGVDADEPSLADFRVGLTSGNGFADEIVTAVGRKGSYTFLRLRWDRDEPHLLFRYVANGGLNYHEYFLVRKKDGKLRARDVYVYLSGETLSATYHRFAIQTAAESKIGLLGRLTGEKREFLDNLEKTKLCADELLACEYDKALATYAGLPDSLRHEKSLMVVMVVATMHAKPDAYPKAIDEFERAFPDDPAVDLIGIDGFYLRKDWPEFHRCVDRIDRRLGGDSWLHVLKGTAYATDGKLDEAKKWLNRALDENPEMLAAHWQLVAVSLKEKNYPAAVRLLERLEKEHRVVVRQQLDRLPGYVEFAKSDEFRAWKESHPKKE